MVQHIDTAVIRGLCLSLGEQQQLASATMNMQWHITGGRLTRWQSLKGAGPVVVGLKLEVVAGLVGLGDLQVGRLVSAARLLPQLAHLRSADVWVNTLSMLLEILAALLPTATSLVWHSMKHHSTSTCTATQSRQPVP